MGKIMEISVTMRGNLKLEESLACSSNLVCRVCLEKNENDNSMYNIFDAKGQTHLGNMIMSCASVQISENDGLPGFICLKCISNLNVAWQFKAQCEMSDAKLRHFYRCQASFTPSIDDFSSGVKELASDAREEEYPFQQAVQETIMSENNKRKVSRGSKETTKKHQQRKIENLSSFKMHQCDTCGKTFNRKEYLTQHIRIHTGEKPYCCHLCEKRFVNSGHLTTHMRKHTGERPHTCTLCPKAFSTRQELQKHTMVHNGDRPFQCKMCGKSFGSSSNLYSHLKHHTGEKNFTCEQCGKAFYTKQELKQHSVVHTGEKAYLCELCNKRFSQVAHLRRHSKLHKNNLQ